MGYGRDQTQSTAPRSCSCAWSRARGRSESASSPRRPSCRRAPPHGSSRRSSGRASSSATATAAPVRPGPVLLRFAQRTEPDVTLVELADEHLDALAAESGETVNLGVPTPLGVDQLSQRRQPALHRLHELGREARPVPPHGERQGLPRLGRGGLRARQPRGSRSDSRARLRDRRRRARGRPDRARRARLRRRRRPPSQHSRSPDPTIRLTAQPHRGAGARARPARARPLPQARPPRRQARCRMTHDEILQGLYDHTLVGDAPEVKELVERGLEDGHGARVDALRRAHPLARGGRRPLRARRLLRARRC